MTVADRMNEITNKARATADAEKAVKYDSYVKTLINGKIAKTARKGNNSCKIRVKASIPLWEVVDRLAQNPKGFKTVSVYGTFAKYVKVSW